MKTFFTKQIERMKANPRNTVIGLLIAVLIIFVNTLSIMGNNKNFASKGHKLVTVSQGMTAGEIAELLHKEKLVQHPDIFLIEARLKGLGSKLQAGTYKIDCGASNGEIVSVLASGKILQNTFTVPEGYNVVKTAHKLEAEGLGNAEKFMSAAKDYAPYEYMQTDNPYVVFKAEGFLFPATYEIPAKASEEEILQLMVKQFNTEMQQSGVLKATEEAGLKLRDVVNLAAMVELEAVFPEEQPRIAGVFLKRLDIGMPIQSDTTIQYILGAQKEVITFKDTEIDNPYNTYKNMGLPPGPIASPGMSSIKSVLTPEQTDYLYFVAEKDGHHYFSKTYDEHLQAIEKIHGES